MRRFIVIILDGVGVGALPDAADYGDAGSNTLGNLSRTVDLRLPNFERLGLGNILPLIGVPSVAGPLCLPGRLAPLSAGKDTTVGHWEHMGLVTAVPFPTFPQGFPDEIVAPFSERIGRGVLGNRASSGTTIMAELGEEHVATGRPIVYTSVDSVFQIAAHVDVVPLEQLYSWCRIARDLLRGRHAMARVIARPFTGPVGAFVRTHDRRDFSLEPSGLTYLDVLEQAGAPVLALGKISDVFVGRGVSEKVTVASNEQNLALLTDLLRRRSSEAAFEEGLLFTNLVDFDMVWGHRNDVEGFALGLEAVDAALPEIIAALGPDDRLIMTADHGVDPTTAGTDHSREYAPLLLYPRPAEAPSGVYEGTFADTGATVYEYLTGEPPSLGGEVITRLRPTRGWRRYTPVQPSPVGTGGGMPGRVGQTEAETAARWLEETLGLAPDVAVVLGSGLAPRLTEPSVAEVGYESIPQWLAGRIPGHPYNLSLVEWMGIRVALLEGRVHEYEGYDLSEVQFQVRTMAAWGVKRLVLTCASGAVGEGFAPGDIVVVREIVDLQHSEAGAVPARLLATNDALMRASGMIGSVHASVPGPQYETPAEIAVLKMLGVATVSMSLAAEVRAAHDGRMDVAALAVVVNAGDTTHEAVLSGSAGASEALTAVIAKLLSAWKSQMVLSPTLPDAAGGP